MQQGASNIPELLEKVKQLAIDMNMRCDNSIQEIIITIDEDGEFTITSD